MRLFAVSVLLVLSSPAFAQPAPAGSCRLDEGLVAQMPAPPSPVITGHPPSDAPPHILAMPLPKMGLAVADVSFHLAADGTVADLKFLCLSPSDSDLGEALKKASRSWKFAPAKQDGKPVAANVSYRLSGAGAVPLNFSPERLAPIQG